MGKREEMEKVRIAEDACSSGECLGDSEGSDVGLPGSGAG